MLQVIGLDSTTLGRVLTRYDTPVYDVCEFSRDGTKLWCVTVPSDEIAAVHCYDARNWQLIAHHSFKPRIGGCGFILTLHPTDDVFGLWVCGGPDEVWNYWIRLTGSDIEFRYQPELDGANPPAFNSRGDRFAAVNEYDLASYSFPDCTSLYPPVGPLDEDDLWAESTCFIHSTSEDRVLAATNEARLFVLSLESGEVVAEVALEGHEPKPCYQVYTSLAKTDDRLCSDLHWFKAVGVNLIISVHTNGKASNRQDTILLWQVRDL
jgi:hypothetical protein